MYLYIFFNTFVRWDSDKTEVQFNNNSSAAHGNTLKL